MHQRVVEARLVRRAVGGEIGDGYIGQVRDRVHHEEVGAHRCPVHLAQAGDLGLIQHAANIEAQRVAELEVQRLGKAFLHADRTAFFGLPGSGGDQIVLGWLGGIGEVEFPVQHALGAVFRVVVRVHLAAIHRDQSPANHGVPIELLHVRLLECLLEGIGLFRQHVDDKAVRRVRRRGLLPAADEIGAQQHQQHQREQTDGQTADLHHRIRRARRDLAGGQHQPARSSRLVHHAAQRLDGQPGKDGEHHHRSGKATHGDRSEFEIAAHGHQQHRKSHHAQTEHQNRSRLEASEIAANHPQRRHLGELQHRWQPKCKHQRDAHAQPKQHRPERGRGQHRIHQAAEHPHKHIVHGKAQRHAEQAGEQADQRELDGVGPCNRALALTQHAQHGRGVDVLVRKAARGQRHGDRGQQGGQQRDEVQKVLRAHQGLVHFRAAAVQRLDAYAAQLMALGLLGGVVLELLHRLGRVARDRKPIRDAAGGLHQSGSFQVLRIDHHARRKAHEAGTAIGLERDDAADLQRRVAQQQGIAHLEPERFEQGRIGPRLSGTGNLFCDGTGLRWLRGHLQTATQRIAGIHTLEGHQLARPALRVTGARHGREGQRRAAAQALFGRLLPETLGRGVVAHHHHVTAEQLQRVALQAALQSVREEAHRRERGDRQGHRDDQQPQLARAHIAPQRSPAQCPCGNRAACGACRHVSLSLNH